MTKSWQRSARCSPDRPLRRLRATQPGNGEGEPNGRQVEDDGQRPERETGVSLDQRAGEPDGADPDEPDEHALEVCAQVVAAPDDRKHPDGSADLDSDVGVRELQAAVAERLRDRGGHEQAPEHHADEHQPHGQRRRIEPARDPAGVHPGRPHRQEQEERLHGAAQREMRKELVRELRHCEDVDEIEEELDRSDAVVGAVARAQEPVVRGHRRA